MIRVLAKIESKNHLRINADEHANENFETIVGHMHYWLINRLLFIRFRSDETKKTRRAMQK